MTNDPKLVAEITARLLAESAAFHDVIGDIIRNDETLRIYPKDSGALTWKAAAVKRRDDLITSMMDAADKIIDVAEQ